MRNTFSILFFIKKNSSKMEYPQTIIARITVNGKSVEVNTGVKSYIHQWNAKRHQIIGKTKETNQKNRTLDNVRIKINQIYYKQTLYAESTTAKTIKDCYTGADKDFHYILSLFSKHNEKIQKQIDICKSAATYQKYEVTRKHLASYIKNGWKTEDIPITRISYRFICDFETYLKTEAKCGHNTTAKFMQFFKRIIIIALNDNYIKINPFQNYQIKLRQVDREFLTMEELEKIINKEFPIKRLEIIRDLFIFSSFTGLAYIDLKNLKKEHLYASIDGNLWIRINRQKTKEMSSIRLFDIPKQLILKYNDPQSEYLFPVPSNQKVNAYLKEVADLCNIKKDITFHVARHTMATTIGLENGLPIESLAKMLGHANIKTTQIYAKITDLKLNKDMDNLERQLTKTTILSL